MNEYKVAISVLGGVFVLAIAAFLLAPWLAWYHDLCREWQERKQREWYARRMSK